MMCNLEPCGHRVLLKPVLEDEKTGWGFDVAAGRADTFAREQGATQIGIIVAVGPSAWLEFKPGEPWAAVGDKVYFAKFAGKDVKVSGQEAPYIIINDEDVQCIIKDEEG